MEENGHAPSGVTCKRGIDLMAFLNWLATRWGRDTPAPERLPSVAPPSRAPLHVPDEYLALYKYLEHRYASNVVLTFAEMESLLGFSLPESAHTRADWWAGECSAHDRHAETWTVAQRKATPNLVARTVAFERLT